MGRVAFREENEAVPRLLPVEGAGLCTMVWFSSAASR